MAQGARNIFPEHSGPLITERTNAERTLAGMGCSFDAQSAATGRSALHIA